MLENSLVTLLVFVVGFIAGRRTPGSYDKQASIRTAQITAYKEILGAFHLADREVTNASLESEANGTVSDAAKIRARDALNALAYSFHQNSFLLPPDVADKYGELSFSFEEWREMMTELREVRREINTLVKRNVFST